MVNLALAAVAAVVALTGSPAVTEHAPSALGLELSAGSRTVALKDSLPLTLTVANGGSSPCAIADMPSGTVQVLELTREGKPVPATYGEVSYTVSLPQQAQDAAKQLAPGERATVTMDSFDLDGRQTLSTVDALPGGGGILSQWQLGEPGKYRLSVRYSVPQTITNACPGVSNVATVEFTISDPPLSRWWFAAAGLFVLLVAAVLIWLALRRRRHRSAAIVLALVAMVLVGTPRPARAEISVMGEPGQYLETGLALGQCLGIFRAPGGDPAKIMPVLDKPGAPLVKVRPQRPGDKSDGYVGNNNDRGGTVYWSPDRPIMLEPGVPSEKCADLYHELAHAKEYAEKGKLDKRPCDSLTVETSEAAATLAENAYRSSRKDPKNFPPRKTYSGLTLPNKVEDCEKRPPDKRKAANECTSTAAVAAAAPECDKDLPRQPQDRAPGMSNGDPHLITFDQRLYDFQAVGEFVAAQSASGDLIIQTRQSPISGSRVASMNTAVAVKVGADRLQLRIVDGQLELRVNGRVENWERGSRSLPGGGKAARRISPVAFNQDGYTIRWPDGSLVWVDPIGFFGVRVFAALAPQRKGAVAGLLGDFDGDPASDLRPRNAAQPLGAPVDADALYHKFGDSWRLTPAESLFSYGEGESTQTFTDPAFPDRVIAANDLDPARKAMAQAICTAAGITDAAHFDACLIDVALTGQPSFAVNTADISGNPVVAHTDTSAAVTRWTGGPVRDGMLVTGEVPAGQAQRFELDLAGAQDFFVTDWRGTTDACDQTFSINLVGISNGNQPCTGQSVRFRVPDVSGRYEVEIAGQSGRGGPFTFTLVTVKPRTFAIRIGDRVASGSIDVRGREDVYEFDAAGAGGVHLTDLPPCEANILASLFDVTENRIIAAGHQLCGNANTFTLANPAHRYGFVIASSTVGTGAYFFTLQAGP